MATAKEIVVSRVPFASAYTDSKIKTFVESAFINCEQCFGIRWVNTEGVDVESWSRVGVEENYNPIQVQLAAVMASIFIIESKSLEETSNFQDNNATKRFVSEVKAGTTDTKFEQIRGENSPMVTGIDNQVKMLREEAKNLSMLLGCHINGNMVSAIFSDSLISSPIYVHKDC